MDAPGVAPLVASIREALANFVAIGLGYIALAEPETVARVEVRGAVHQGLGEMENLKHLRDNRYAVQYNIDGESWLYEGEFDEDTCAMRLDAEP